MEKVTFSIELSPAIAAPLLRWYARHARVLPWRSQPEPYRVWVSEIMLQQTRVEAVLPYFERFIGALPDIRTLAGAPEELLLKLWEGLGYYNRVRNLQKAAKVVVEQYGGQLPGDYGQLLALPGFGEYTAGAVASIAFGIRVPAVDGNVLRVLARLLASDADIKNAKARAVFREAAAAMQPEEHPGDFNQAMMELGATVCLPNTRPHCGECPLAERCEGRKRGIAETLPVKASAKPRTIEERTVLVVISGGRVLLHRREGRGLLAGMWELPNVRGFLDAPQALAAAAGFGARAQAAEALEEGKHIFSHIEWRLHGFRLDVPAFLPPQEYLFADMEDLKRVYALPSAFRTYARHLKKWLAHAGGEKTVQTVDNDREEDV